MKRWKKTIPVVLVFFALFLVFYFTEEKPEDSTTVNFWKYDFDRLDYTPPNKEFDVDGEYISKAFRIERIIESFSGEPKFWIVNTDSLVEEEIIYESSYITKNLFTELASFNTYLITKETEELKTQFGIKEVGSPKLVLWKDGKAEKTILFGKTNKDKLYTYISVEGFIIGLPSTTADKFKGSFYVLRDKQILSGSGIHFRSINLEGELQAKLENDAFKEKEVLKQNWFIYSGKKKRLNPNTGTRIDGLVRGFYTEVYPDEPEGKGFSVLLELLKEQTPVYILHIELTNGKKIKLSFYPKTSLDANDFYPMVKIVDGKKLSPVYIKTQTLNDFITHIKYAQEEPEWQAQKKK
jgi:hypothetical protein